jgi:hypothetical protein
LIAFANIIEWKKIKNFGSGKTICSGMIKKCYSSTKKVENVKIILTLQ